MSSSSSFGSGTSFGTTPLGTSPFYNVSALIDGVLYATSHGNPSTETNKRRAILQFINNTYQEVCLGYHWRWLNASYDFRLAAPYETGTASATQGLYTVTGSGTLWSANLSPKNLFWFSGSHVVYHVSEVTSSTALTLESKFSEDDITDTAYTVATSQYELPPETDNILNLTVDSDQKVDLIGWEDFRLMQSRDPTRTGKPIVASLMRRETDDDAIYLEVWPAPDKYYQCHIDYTVRILKLDDSTDCYPIVPDRYRAVLYYGALEQFYLFLEKPNSAVAAGNKFRSMLTSMRNDKQLTDQELVMMPARSHLRRGIRNLTGITMSVEDFGREG